MRCAMGPIGSGKSVAMVMDLLMIAAAQHQGKDGIRRTRHLIVRNTYAELRDTTIKTFFDFVPQGCGEWRPSRSEFTLRTGDVHAEFLFRALDRPKDVRKLLSLEITTAWLNEAREIPKVIFDAVQGRVGRYPAKRQGGPKWWGVLIDTNPPDTDHWIHRLFEEDRPADWNIWHQPSGISEESENIENLPDQYYQRMMHGKTQDWINVYVHGKYGDISDGRPVLPEFNSAVHVQQEADMPEIETHGTVYVGQDYGLTPAAVFAQKVNGHWNIHHEVATEDMGAVRFAKLCKEVIVEHYPGCKVKGFGDPSGNSRSQADESTPIQIMNAGGVPTEASPDQSNDPVLRRESVAKNLLALAMDGKPVVRVSTACRHLIKGMASKYAYKRIQVIGDERYRDTPDKNIYSHVCEATEYMFVGAGEGDSVVGDTSTDDYKPLKYKTSPGRVRR